MILERLALSGFRSFVNPFVLEPGPKLTVIHAPNGTGKSTLFDALYCGLLERHNASGGHSSKRMKSVGRELSPEVEIDFSVEGVRYRVRKVFLAGARSSTILERSEGASYKRLHQAQAADDYLRELLCAETAHGGIKTAEHLGLAHILWSPSQAEFDDLPAQANERIRSMLGSSTVAITQGERDIKERVAAELLQYYVPSGKKYATSADSANIPDLEKRLGEARKLAGDAAAQYDKLAILNREYESRKADLLRIEARRTTLREELVKVKRDVEKRNELSLASERAQREEAEARALFDRLNAERLTLERLTRELTEQTGAHEAVHAEAARTAREQSEINERLSSARTQSENAQAVLSTVQQRANEVTAAEAYVAARVRLDGDITTLAGYDSLRLECEAARAELSTAVAPTSDEIEDFRKVHADIAVVDGIISGSALSIEIESVTNATIDVIAGACFGPISLAVGSLTKIDSDGTSIVIEVPGLGRLRASGSDGAANSRKKRDALVAKHDLLREAYGTDAIGDLVARRKQADALEHTIVALEQRMVERLSGSAEADLRSSVVTLRARITTIEAANTSWIKTPPDAVALRTASDAEFEKARLAAQTAAVELETLHNANTTIGAKLAAVRAHEAKLSQSLQENESQRRAIEADGYDATERADRERKAAVALFVVETEECRITDELARFVTDPNETLAQLERVREAIVTEYDTTQRTSIESKATLELQASLGNYTTLVSAQESVVRCEERLAFAMEQAAAIKCLSDAFKDVEAQRIASVIQPVATAASAFFEKIVGYRFGDIAFGDGFAPAKFVDHSSGEAIALKDGTLSGGEKEQIYLASRLALADVLAKTGERQLFVIDDAMTATDPGRLLRFIDILERLTERLQIIITTADKSRYVGIAGAHYIDLAAELRATIAA